MEREEALRRIEELKGKDLRPLADQVGITVWKTEEGRLTKNKGWAGHVIERHLGLPLNSSRAPNFGSWELKTVSLKYDSKRVLKVKETIAITNIDATEVLQKEFEESHLFNKLRKQIIVARIFESVQDTSSILYGATNFDLDDPYLYAQAKQDYETVRETLRTQGFSALTGKMGVIIQPRTKGPGHGSTSRAFYARTQLVAHMLNLVRLPWLPPIAETASETLPDSEE